MRSSFSLTTTILRFQHTSSLMSFITAIAALLNLNLPEHVGAPSPALLQRRNNPWRRIACIVLSSMIGDYRKNQQAEGHNIV
ncbi:hypothetical protein C8R47DRAFT_1322544 [Mycena vitilis]|nr:hypothetical protein C8R47DRAFT_1322544 [Mycena vitilis]